MELNSNAKKILRIVDNPEGSTVVQRQPELQLYLEASCLNIKEDDFYTSSQEKISKLINSANLCSPEYVFGLSLFLSDCGLKLAPVVLLTSLSDRGCKFGELDIELKMRMYDVFNTPQRIAEAIALDNLGYLSIKHSFKNVLKHCLENMSKYTLLKNKMNSRKIKLKDLIKLLRPHPRPELEEVYYDIISDGPFSKLEEKTLLQIKSDKHLSISEKLKYYNDNINTIPLNMLIRNLKFIADNTDFRTNIRLQEKIVNRLESIDKQAMRFINMFDLVEAAINVPVFEKALFTVIQTYISNIKKQFNFTNNNATVLLDFSGSMAGQGIDRGFKWLVVMSLLFDKLDLRVFSDSLRTEDLNGQIIDIKKGQLARAKQIILNYMKQWTGGTALVQSTNDLLNEKPEIQNLIVISDEVSWVEGDDLLPVIGQLNSMLVNRKLILINPVATDGTIFKKQVVGFGGLTPNMLYTIFLHTTPTEFVNFIRFYV